MGDFVLNAMDELRTKAAQSRDHASTPKIRFRGLF